MMKDGSGDKELLKERVKKWMAVSHTKKWDAFDMMILETFYYIYNGIEQGFNIQELGNELGIFPLP